MQGFFDFAPIEKVAADIASDVLAKPQPEQLHFRHYSGGVKVPPNEFKAYMEQFYNKEFVELELEEWLTRALELGIEPLITVYLRATFGGGGNHSIVFPYMGESE